MTFKLRRIGGHDSTFVYKAKSTRLRPEPSSSWVIQLMDRTWVTRPWGESQVKSTLIIGQFRGIAIAGWVICQSLNTLCVFYNRLCKLAAQPLFLSFVTALKLHLKGSEGAHEVNWRLVNSCDCVSIQIQ